MDSGKTKSADIKNVREALRYIGKDDTEASMTKKIDLGNSPMISGLRGLYMTG